MSWTGGMYDHEVFVKGDVKVLEDNEHRGRESEDLIISSHSEQVVNHMKDIEHFGRLLIVTRKGRAEEKARELKGQIPGDDSVRRCQFTFYSKNARK